MQYISRIFKRYAIAALVRQSMRRDQKVTRKAIMECQTLLAEAFGEAWHQASREAAAGMVLVKLAKDSALGERINDRGWDLVLTFVGDHSRLVGQVSRRAMADIFAWQSMRLEALLAKTA